MIAWILISAVVGAVLGSFACCQAWRLWCKETGKKQVKGQKIGKRSMCFSCGKQLKWYENIPVISWVLQGGKCRKCGAEIGRAEILCELIGAVMMAGLGWKMWMMLMDIGNAGMAEAEGLLEVIFQFGLMFWFARVVLPIFGIFSAIFLTLLLIVGIYDARWGRVPVKIVMAAIVMGAVYAGFGLISSTNVLQTLVNLLMSCGILGGIYYLIYKFSHEKLVGGGDWMVGLAIGLFLSDWWLSLLVLFLSNLSALIVMIPQHKKKIAFGPFLVFAFYIVFIFSNFLLAFKI